MNNDLISREALKKAFLGYCRSEIEAINHFWYDENIISIIDNAPTVEPHYISDLPDDVVKTLQTLAIDYSDGIAIFERKRPQGEWELIKDKGNNIHAECPFCKFQIKCIAYNYSIWEVKQFIKNNDFDFEFPKFCENCGARMKGGAE